MTTSTVVHITRNAAAGSEGTWTLFQAFAPGALPLGTLSLWVTGLLLAAVALKQLHRAVSLVDEEYSRTRAERDAFDEFADRVAAIDATATRRARNAGVGASLVAEGGGDSSEPARVRRAYRETVMSVPHYEEEYGEPLATHMSRDLGDEGVRAVVHQGRFNPIIKRALVAKARRAAQLRADFLSTLDDEREALGSARELYADVAEAVGSMNEVSLSERSYDELVDSWQRLRNLERRCEARLEDRQRQIQETKVERPTDGAGPGDERRNGTGNEDGHRSGTETLPEYLYHPMDVSYPVLHEGLEVLETVRLARSRVFGASTWA